MTKNVTIECDSVTVYNNNGSVRKHFTNQGRYGCSYTVTQSITNDSSIEYGVIIVVDKATNTSYQFYIPDVKPVVRVEMISYEERNKN